MLNVQHVGAWQTIRVPLSDGDIGVEETIQYIRQLVDEGLTDPRIRRVATEIVRNASVPPYDELAEVRAVFDWASNWRNVRFVKDMIGKEMLQPAWSILESGAGDCDCINAILLPSLLGAIGYATRAVTVAADPSDPENFSHIYIEVFAGDNWIPLDVARPGAAWGRTPERFWRIRRWPLMDAAEIPGQDISALPPVRPATNYLNGIAAIHPAYRTPAPVVRTRRVMPRFGMGQDDGGGILEQLGPILKTVPGIEQGAAQIIAAGNQPSYGVRYPITSTYPQSGTAVITASTGGTSFVTLGLLAIAAIIGIKVLGR
jgi:hypothetical protein